MRYDKFSKPYLKREAQRDMDIEKLDIEVADKDIIEHLPTIGGGNYYDAVDELISYKKSYYEAGMELGYERELIDLLWAKIMGEFNESISSYLID